MSLSLPATTLRIHGREGPSRPDRASEGCDQVPRSPLLRARGSRDFRRRIRRAAAGAGVARGSPPASGDHRLADPAGGDLPVRNVRSGPAPAADVLAGQRRDGRRVGGLDGPDGTPVGPPARRPGVRVEDRWPGGVPHLRTRGAHPFRHPGRRGDRGGRDRHRQDHPVGPATAAGGCPGIDGGPRRGVHAASRVRGTQRPAGRGGGADVRQRSECGGRISTPEGSGRDRRTQPLHLGLPGGLHGGRFPAR